MALPESDSPKYLPLGREKFTVVAEIQAGAIAVVYSTVQYSSTVIVGSLQGWLPLFHRLLLVVGNIFPSPRIAAGVQVGSKLLLQYRRRLSAQYNFKRSRCPLSSWWLFAAG